MIYDEVIYLDRTNIFEEILLHYSCIFLCLNIFPFVWNILLQTTQGNLNFSCRAWMCVFSAWLFAKHLLQMLQVMLFSCMFWCFLSAILFLNSFLHTLHVEMKQFFTWKRYSFCRFLKFRLHTVQTRGSVCPQSSSSLCFWACLFQSCVSKEADIYSIR